MSFLIWFQHRSGSTHLVSLLNSHPEIKCKGEIFGCFRLGGIQDRDQYPHGVQLGDEIYCRVLNLFPGKIENPSDARCQAELEDFLIAKTQYPNKICGFKFKFPSQWRLYPTITDRLKERSDEIGLIVLTRKNLLRRAISVLNLENVQSVSNRANLRESSPMKPEIYDVGEILRLIRYYESIDREFKDWASLFSQRMELDYDQLTGEAATSCDQLLDFVGVNEKVELSSKTRKITSSNLCHQVLNFDQLKSELEAAGYSRFLD